MNFEFMNFFDEIQAMFALISLELSEYSNFYLRFFNAKFYAHPFILLIDTKTILFITKSELYSKRDSNRIRTGIF